MRKRTVALLLDYATGEYQEELRAGVERAAIACGAELLTLCGRALEAQPAREGALNHLYGLIDPRRVTGAIVAGVVGTRCSEATLEEFVARLAPIPVCSIGLRIRGAPALAVNDKRAMRLVMDHVVSHGRRRIAFIRGPEASGEAEERFAAYRETLRENGLPYVAALVATGSFNVPTGAAAMEAILERGEGFDAVVAANDSMAIGAAEVLHARGLAIPQQVLVAGFDDFPLARFADPPLTTVRQPVQRLGERAVETLLALLEGKDVPMLAEVPSELVVRGSCGCARKAWRAGNADSKSLLPERSAEQVIRSERAVLEHRLRQAARLADPTAELLVINLVDAIEQQLAGSEGRFLHVLEDELEAALRRNDPIDEFHKLIAVLRAELAGDSERKNELEKLWHSAGVLIDVTVTRAESRELLTSDFSASVIRETIALLSTALTHDALKAGLVDLLPKLKVSHSVVALYDEGSKSKLRCFFATLASQPAPVGDDPYDAWMLTPPGFDLESDVLSLVAQPLTFGTEQLGVLLLESRASKVVYDVLREQISAALKAALLHRSVVHEAALRQRAERAELEGELRIAERIQTAILPHDPQLPWLSTAAKMVPAVEVGGDYYDIQPVAGACWVGIGDVTGHGLRAGLVMLMIQSMVSSLVEQSPGADPAAIVNRLNAALYRNVRERLGFDDHATFSLLRVDADGRVTWAGAHEDIIVQRAGGRCELYEPRGAWIGARADIGFATQNQELRLNPGDRLILYTDGLIEAMDAHKAQFGLDRAVSLIEAQAHTDVRSVTESLVAAVQAFSVSQQDDITVVTLEYKPE